MAKGLACRRQPLDSGHGCSRCQTRQQEGRMMVTEALIATMVNRIVEQFHPLRVVLFGYRVRGTVLLHTENLPLVYCNCATIRVEV